MDDLHSRQQEFLSRTKDAEEQAAKCIDPDHRARWLRIADGYRNLAKTTH
jgi:hypothetical protein